MKCKRCGIDIEEHQAGECLDAWFCEDVMKWIRNPTIDGLKWIDPKTPEHIWAENFKPSTDIAAAMEGVEKHRKVIFLEIRILPKIVYIGLFPNEPGKFLDVYSRAETVELAVTRVLIMWAGKEG